MIKRCEHRNRRDYQHYGARGIRVCEEWHDFEVFYEWAMTHGYRQGLTIDRVNNNAGYNPGNCRWISARANANNRTTSSRYTVDGHTKTLTQWCRLYNIPDYVVVHRINDYGWSVEDAIKTPRGEKPLSKRRWAEAIRWPSMPHRGRGDGSARSMIEDPDYKRSV